MRLRAVPALELGELPDLRDRDQLLRARRGGDEVLERRASAPAAAAPAAAELLARATPRSAAVGSIVIAHRLSASWTSVSRCTPSRANARDTRSCSATSQTIVRRPVRGGREAERGGDGRLADPALARDVEQRAGRAAALPSSCAQDDDARHGSRARRGLRDVPAHAPAPRPHVLLGHAPPARARSGRPRTRSTATCARPTRSSTARAAPPTPDGAPRRARRLGGRARTRAGGGGSPHPVVGALVDAGRAPPPAARRAAAPTCARCGSTARPVRIETWEELEAYMDGSAGSVGRIMAPLLGVPGAPPRRLRPPRPGVPARELHPRRARGLAAGPHLPAGRGPRALRRRRGRPRRPARDARAARARRARGRAARARCSRAPSRAVAAAPASVRPGIRLRRRASTCACSTASRRSASTCSAAAPACAPGSSRASRSAALRR